MANADAEVLAKLQGVLTALLKHQLEQSLGNVEAALDRWRAGEIGPFEAHAEVLRHAARSERVATRIAEVRPANAPSVLRDAFDAGLVDREAFVAMAGRPPGRSSRPACSTSGRRPPRRTRRPSSSSCWARGRC
jgi:hypothetical protein